MDGVSFKIDAYDGMANANEMHLRVNWGAVNVYYMWGLVNVNVMYMRVNWDLVKVI